MLREAPSVSHVQSGCRGDDSRVGIDGKVATIVIEEAVVTVLVVASESLDDVVIPTTVPMATFSSTALAVPSVSVGP